MSERKCKTCLVVKPLNKEYFRETIRYGRIYFRYECSTCNRAKSVSWQRTHKERAKRNTAKFRLKNPDYVKSWKKSNQEHVRNYIKEYENRGHVKLRKRLSRAIHHCLRGTAKNISVLDILPYSIDDLKAHLESKFEPWMRWDNWGNYNSETWKDNDPATWTWQIDHIQPLASFSFETMHDLAFKQAWSLKNLRPLSAKQNICDGASRKRMS